MLRIKKCLSISFAQRINDYQTQKLLSLPIWLSSRCFRPESEGADRTDRFVYVEDNKKTLTFTYMNSFLPIIESEFVNTEEGQVFTINLKHYRLTRIIQIILIAGFLLWLFLDINAVLNHLQVVSVMEFVLLIIALFVIVVFPSAILSYYSAVIRKQLVNHIHSDLDYSGEFEASIK